jgi:ABC-type antimicrobial peptide transport system permease subunit
MAIGARPSGIARLVTGEAFAMVLIGAVGGLALGVASVRSIQSLIFDVKATGFVALAVPAAAIFGAAMLAALPALVRAVRIDPAVTLRAE